MNTPIIWTLKGFCDHFRFVHTKMHDHSFGWVLGAGASRASGIPTGGELVDAWLHEMHQRLDRKETPFEQWATEETLEIKGFSLKNASSFYSRVYERRFLNHPDEGYAYLEELMMKKDPSPGYSILAKTIENTRHRLVVTTNFDNLIADALALYTDTFPFIVGHESLTGFVRAAMRRPLVCKIHRDLLLGPLSDPRSLKRLHETWAGALRSLFIHYTPVFIGYGGNDDSLMDLLESLDRDDIKGQMIWCYHEKSEPSERIKDLVIHHRGVLVPVPDFDLLMILLGSGLGIEPLDTVIEERAQKRAANYRERVLAIDTLGHPEVATALSSALERAGGWWAWEARAQRETDPNKREALYLQGLHKFPQSAELRNSFALFLLNICGRSDEADTVISKALEATPQNVTLLLSQASIRADNLNKIDEAEESFKLALTASPDNPFSIAVYADFIGRHKGRIDEAEALLRKALSLQPDNALLLRLCGNFFAQRRADLVTAEQYFRKSVELDPNSSAALNSLGAFLSDYGDNSPETEELLRQAMKLAPKDQGIAANYAEFLLTRRRYADAKTAIYRARQIKPGHHTTTGVLILLEAILNRIEGREDTRPLGMLKSIFSKGIRRDSWNISRLQLFITTTLASDDTGFYISLSNVFSNQGNMSTLEPIDRWRATPPINPE